MVKQRVIGAVVLVALAVIFVPMLFERGEDDLGPVGSNLPNQPEPVVRDRIEPLTLPEPPADPEPPPVVLDSTPSQAPAEALTPNAGQPADAPTDAGPAESASAAPAPATATDSAAATTTQSAPPAAEAEAQPTPEPVPAASTSAPAVSSTADGAAPLSGWVVQLASLSNKDNALALRDRLQKLGYTAFVEETSSTQGVLYRVRVGPELERANAEQKRDRLQEQVKLKGIVTSYP